VLDSIYVIEQAMQHFFLRAKNAGRKQADSMMITGKLLLSLH
jgi:hypothetical protein